MSAPAGDSKLLVGLNVAIVVLSFANLVMAAWGLCWLHRIEAMLLALGAGR